MSKTIKRTKRQKKLETAVKQLNTLFNSSLLHIEEEIVSDSRLKEFHPSSLPFCGLRDAYRRMKNNGVVNTREVSLSSMFYTEMGKVAHEVVQNWMSKLRYRMGEDFPKDVELQLLGNWKCRNNNPDVPKSKRCNGTRTFSEYKPCAKCGSEMDYVEISYSSLPLKFSVDKVIKIDKYYIILDFKFTTSLSISVYKSRGMKLPYLSNREQIRGYASIFDKVFSDKLKGGKVIGWVLIYLSRDHPTTEENRVFIHEAMSDEDKIKKRKSLRKDIRHFKLSRGKKLNKKKLVQLMEEKPCPTKAWYDKNMHSVFNPCELASCGACFKPKKLKKKVKDAYREYSAKRKAKK